MVYEPITFNVIDVEIYGGITRTIEIDPQYFIPLIFKNETAEIQAILLEKFNEYRRIELFSGMGLDIEKQKILNLHITGRYNDLIKKKN